MLKELHDAHGLFIEFVELVSMHKILIRKLLLPSTIVSSSPKNFVWYWNIEKYITNEVWLSVQQELAVIRSV